MKIKRALNDLAIFGGTPTFAEPLHVGRPNIGDVDAVLSRIRQALESRWLTNNGPLVQEFEHEVARLLGVKHCIAMCNATIALEITIRALGLSGEVIVPSFTFIATAHALQWQEITPVFCDIHPHTHTLDPRRVEALITPRTTGIIGVHIWGHACDIEALTEIAKRHNLGLIFDAAHAFACSHSGLMIGNFGNAEVLSFHATKFFNTFEGGAVVTNDDHLAKKIRLMQNFGFEGYDNVVYIGTNGKMSEPSAAMGLSGLETLSAIIGVNERNYEQYRRGLAEIPGIRLYPHEGDDKHNYHYVVIEVDEMEAGPIRDALVDILWADNVRARRYFYPGCHRMEPYRSYFPHAHLLLPETEELVKKVLVVPTGNAVSLEDVDAICQIIRFVIENSQEIQPALRTRNGAEEYTVPTGVQAK